MSRCENFLEMSSRYLDGDLNPDEEQSLLSHLAECPDCRRAYEAMRAVSLELDVTDAPEGFAAGVMGAVRAAAPGRRPRRLAAGRGRAARIAALAACCALIAAAGLKLASESGPAANESEPASFGAVSVERDIAPANAGDVVDRDITGDDAEPAVSASSCAAKVDAVTVQEGEVVSHSRDGGYIAELAEILSWSRAAESAPQGEPDWVITAEVDAGELVLNVWDEQGELLCEDGSGEAWYALGDADELREALT